MKYLKEIHERIDGKIFGSLFRLNKKIRNHNLTDNGGQFHFDYKIKKF